MFNNQIVLQKAKEFDVKFVRLQFTDICGTLKNIAITVEHLEEALKGELRFDSSVIEGFDRDRETDVILLPDPDTFEVFPWRPREGAVARLICDIYNPDGQPFPGCPRLMLKKVLAEAEGLGLTIQVGAEAEFFLFFTDEKGKPLTCTHDLGGHCDVSPVDLGENARRDMVLTLESMGFDIGASHHEFAPGQHEIDFRRQGALTMADQLITFRFVVRTIAQRHGLYASFMPKPLMGVPGSGLHLQQLLFRDGLNAFADGDQPSGLSAAAQHYIAGLLEHAPGYAALTNPLVNSYKRLVPKTGSPVYLGWSEQNRYTLVRIPSARGQETGVEVRHPDPACNPYLALGALTAAGLDGVKKQLVPPVPVEIIQPGDPEGSPRLPRNLDEALRALGRDDIIRTALGPYIYRRFVELKQEEWDSFHNYVHQWEIDHYLTRY